MRRTQVRKKAERDELKEVTRLSGSPRKHLRPSMAGRSKSRADLEAAFRAAPRKALERSYPKIDHQIEMSERKIRRAQAMNAVWPLPKEAKLTPKEATAQRHKAKAERSLSRLSRAAVSIEGFAKAFLNQWLERPVASREPVIVIESPAHNHAAIRAKAAASGIKDDEIILTVSADEIKPRGGKIFLDD